MYFCNLKGNCCGGRHLPSLSHYLPTHATLHKSPRPYRQRHNRENRSFWCAKQAFNPQKILFQSENDLTWMCYVWNVIKSAVREREKRVTMRQHSRHRSVSNSLTVRCERYRSPLSSAPDQRPNVHFLYKYCFTHAVACDGFSPQHNQKELIKMMFYFA